MSRVRMPVCSNKLSENKLEKWLWEAACIIRGEIDASKYKEFVLPLIFLKRLSDVFDDEIEKIKEKYGSKDIVKKFSRAKKSLLRFYIPEKARWSNISRQQNVLGEYLTDAVKLIAHENPRLQGVINIVDFNATTAGQRIISEARLKSLIDILGRYRLGLYNVDPDIFGRAYEYLLRKFAEGSGQSGGEFLTPMEVATLMTSILDPQSGDEIYDPACGTGGLLIKTYQRFKEKIAHESPFQTISFFGQEINPSTFSMAKINAFVHEMEVEMALGDTINHPSFVNEDGSLRTFSKVTGNPPWNQKFSPSLYEKDPYNRFNLGFPPASSGDWGWIQHMNSSLSEEGKMVVVLDTGSVSRGSGVQGNHRERDIRKYFITQDLIEAIVLLPENLFYNTAAPGVILIINRKKKRKHLFLMINASKLFHKKRPKNVLPNNAIEKIYDIYAKWREVEGISKIISVEVAIKHDYNLIPSLYVVTNDEEEVLSPHEAILRLKKAEKGVKKADSELKKVLNQLGLEL